MSFLSRLFAALARAMGAIRNGLAGIYGHLSDAVSEAAEPITSRLPWARDRLADAGDVAARAPGYAAIAAGKVLSVPGAVLGALGSLLPAGPLTPKAVAEQAVADDDHGLGGGGVLPGIFGRMVQGAADGLRTGGERELARSEPLLTPDITAWLRGLDARDLATAATIDPAVLERHVTAERLSDCSPMLPALPHLQPKMAPRDEIEAIIAKARALRAAEDREVVAMSRRGIRPAAEPTWDDEPIHGVRPAFH